MRRLVSIVAVAMTLAGCFSVQVHTTGAASVEDLAAEDAYIAVYMQHMTQLGDELKVFLPSGSNPGPCNRGGSQRDCFNADARAIDTMNGMLTALKGTAVPPRFAEADGLLRDALTKNIAGLELRNQSIATGDDGLWQQHTQTLQGAQQAWTAAYAAFPEDHRPPLGQ